MEFVEWDKRFSDQDAPGVSIELLDFLTLWLQHHILLHDKKYAPCLRGET
ncbi:MAG: hypothetical protein Q8R76_11530 [Candidatus Omnitrophota bacterium]|nr:hypothetical protein [Candidatus Omnitrophota bacterium]